MPNTLPQTPDPPISSLTLHSTQKPHSGPPLPIILCLHGRGSNATILSFQTRLILARLGETFEFLFLNGPYISEAGPGILPWFEGMGPYYHWGSPTLGTGKGDGDGDEEEERRELEDVNRAVDVVLRGKDASRVVGVLGFSQGTRVVSGLLARQQILGVESGRANLRFGVFVCGGGGLSFSPFDLVPSDFSTSISKDMKKEIKISIPSLHVHGKHDEIAEKGHEMVEAWFDGSTARVMVVDAGHHFPRGKEEVKEVCWHILEMFEKGREEWEEGVSRRR